MTEKELRKAVREEVRKTLAEENIITKVLGKVLDGLSASAQKRALKKLKQSDFYKDIQAAAATSPAVKSQLDLLDKI